MPRIAWFSPLTKHEESKSALSTWALLGAAPGSWDVEVFTSDACWRSLNREHISDVCGFSYFVHHQAFIRNAQKPFDAFVFQIENDPACSFAHRASSLWPGIIICHDTGFGRLELQGMEHATTGEMLNRRLKELHGEDAPELGDWQSRGWSIDAVAEQYLDTLSSLQATHFVVTSERAFAELRARKPETSVSLTTPPVRVVPGSTVAEERKQLRSELGLGEGQFVIGTAARQSLEDRPQLIFEAFQKLRSPLSGGKAENQRLLWFVENQAQREAIEKMLKKRVNAEADLEHVLFVESDHSAQPASTYLSACDIFLAPAFSAVNGIRPVVYEALARGIPTVVSRFGAQEELPASSVLQLDLGRVESEQLWRVLDRIASDNVFRFELSRRARSFVETCCAPEASALDIDVILSEMRLKNASALKGRRDGALDLRASLILDLSERLYTQLEEPLQDSAQEMIERTLRDFHWKEERL